MHIHATSQEKPPFSIDESFLFGMWNMDFTRLIFSFKVKWPLIPSFERLDESNDWWMKGWHM